MRAQRSARVRRGVTLIELLVAAAVLALIAGALGALATAVQVSTQHSHGIGQVLQHGRVALERIQRALNEATANEQFPGFVVFSERIGSHDYPDTLVVWHPSGAAADPQGMPLISELVVFCTDPSAPNQLLEITAPNDNRTAPSLSDATAWQTELNLFKTGEGPRRVQLTNLVRVADATGGVATPAALRGAIRFAVRLSPSENEWDEFLAGSREWADISWVQGMYGAETGLRQALCRVELQLAPDHVDDNSVDAAIPFFGSGAVYFHLRRS